MRIIKDSPSLGKVVTVKWLRHAFDWMTDEDFKRYLEEIREEIDDRRIGIRASCGVTPLPR